MKLVDLYTWVQTVLVAGGTLCILLSAFMARRFRLATRLVSGTTQWDARSQDMATKYVIQMEDRRKTTYNRVHDIMISRPVLVAVPFIVGIAAFVAAYFVIYAAAVGVLVAGLIAVIIARAVIEPSDAIEASVFVKFVATAGSSRLNSQDKVSIEDATRHLANGSTYFLALGACLLTLFGLDRYFGVVYTDLYETTVRLVGLGLTADFVRFWTLFGLVTITSFIFIRIWSHALATRQG